MRLTLLVLAVAAAGAGCVGVPQTTISGTLGGTPFSLSSPKDSTLVGLRLESSTNGVMQLRIERLEVRMNPDVVSMTGRAQVDLVNAVAAGVAEAAKLSRLQSITPQNVTGAIPPHRQLTPHPARRPQNFPLTPRPKSPRLKKFSR